MRLADQASIGWDGLSNQSHPGAKALVMRPTGRNGASNRVYPLGACVRASWVLLDRGARVRSCLTGLPIIALDGFVDPAFSNRALARLPVGLGLGFMDVILE